MPLHMSADDPFQVGVNYLDSDGHIQYFCQETEANLFQKLKNRLDLPAEVNWIEIGSRRIEVAPAKMAEDTQEVDSNKDEVKCSRYHLDSPYQWLLGLWSKLMLLLGWVAVQPSTVSDTPSGEDSTRETESRKWKLDPNAQWEISASDFGEDGEGEILYWMDHSPDVTEEEAREIIEEFFRDPDFLGFQPNDGDFPTVTSNEDIYLLVEAIHWRICQNQKRQRRKPGN